MDWVGDNFVFVFYVMCVMILCGFILFKGLFYGNV